jgi:hypothetical protein
MNINECDKECDNDYNIIQEMNINKCDKEFDNECDKEFDNCISYLYNIISCVCITFLFC